MYFIYVEDIKYVQHIYTHLLSCVMLDLKAGLLVVPTEAELELEVTPLHPL